jgi:hypothetical protein
MPLSDEERAKGWKDSDELPKLPKQELAPEHAQAFLDALFAQSASKPAEIRLREGARVARYLKALALSSPPGEEHKLLMGLAEATWRLVFEVAPIQMATREEVLRFLKRYERTYFGQRNVKGAVGLIRNSASPEPRVDFFRPPKLVSVRGAVQGIGGPRVSDDLSERIYAAYYALRRVRLRGSKSLRSAGALDEVQDSVYDSGFRAAGLQAR